MSSFQAFNFFDTNEHKQKKQNTEINQNKQQYQINLIQQVAQSSEYEKKNSFNDSKSVVYKREKKLGSVCNFIGKIFQMLEQVQIQNIVSWVYSKNGKNESSNQTANSFRILNVNRFEQEVLPKYFKHSNLSSFIRQLNMYGFHKLRGEKGDYQFQHQKFIKNRKDLLGEIRRKHTEFIGISTQNLSQTQRQNEKSSKQSQENISLNPLNSQAKLLISQQQIFSLKQDNSENIFPSQIFLQNQTYKEKNNDKFEDSSIELIKLRKISNLQEQNTMLKKIKQNKVQKIREFNNLSKSSSIQIKFSKILLSFLSYKFRQENNMSSKNKNQSNKSKQKNIFNNTNQIIDHIFNNSLVQKFQNYKQSIKRIIQNNQND